MKSEALDSVKTADLVARYIALSVKQSTAHYEEDVAIAAREYNRLYRATHAISDVLRARGVEARNALVPLLQHANPQVRLNAAHQLLAVTHDEAYAALQKLGDGPPGLFRLRARMALEGLADGTYKPT